MFIFYFEYFCSILTVKAIQNQSRTLPSSLHQVWTTTELWRTSWYRRLRRGVEGLQPPTPWRHTIMASGPARYLTGDVFGMNNTFVSWHCLGVLDNGFCCFNLYRMKDATAKPTARCFIVVSYFSRHYFAYSISFVLSLLGLHFKHDSFYFLGVVVMHQSAVFQKEWFCCNC